MTPLAKERVTGHMAPPSNRPNRTLVAMVALAVVIVTAAVILFISWPRVRTDATVPDLSGMTRGDAEKVLHDRGLQLGTVTDGLGTAETVGLVIYQDPAASTRVPPLAAVDLIVGAAPTPGSGVPAVSGLTAQEAAKRIRQAGLTPIQVDQFSSAAPIGTVLGQYPWGDASRYIENDVVILVSAGSRARAVIIPQVIGLTESAAVETLTGLGLEPHVSHTTEDTETPVPMVIRQIPAKGQTVPPHGTVSIVVPR